MNPIIPSAADIAALLAPLRTQHLERLSELSGVPFHTLLKIKSGETSNPRLETVRMFAQHISAAQTSR